MVPPVVSWKTMVPAPWPPYPMPASEFGPTLLMAKATLPASLMVGVALPTDAPVGRLYDPELRAWTWSAQDAGIVAAPAVVEVAATAPKAPSITATVAAAACRAAELVDARGAAV